MLTFPRETVEYLPITGVTFTDEDGEPLDLDYEVSVVEHRARPTGWVAEPYLIDGLDPAYYDTYIRPAGAPAPEVPVLLVGTFAVI